MEESIGYEALFSREEWDDISFGHWCELNDDPDPGPGEVSLQGERVEESHPVAVYGPPTDCRQRRPLRARVRAVRIHRRGRHRARRTVTRLPSRGARDA